MKKLKKSNRGLTFSLEESGIEIGAKYHYFIKKESKEVVIVLDENGTNTVSRKKAGKSFKPLFDIRTKEVKELCSSAEFMEVVVEKNRIVVKTYAKIHSGMRIIRNNIISICDLIGEQTGEIILDKAVGSTWSDQMSLFDDAYMKNVYTQMSNCGIRETEKPHVKKVYDIVSLFSGAGLFDKAWLDDGRFRFVYANDFCEDVIDTYKYNIGNHITCKDIRDIEPNEIPASDVIVASPCCQAFSNANRHNLDSKESEEKRLLVDEVVRIADAKKPKVIVVENVPQMISKESGKYINHLLDGLSEYEASVQVVTDCEVGGYSKRSRCIVILSRIGKIELPKMKVLTSKTVKDALSKVDATWYNYNDVTVPSAKTMEKMSYVPQGGNWKDIPVEISGYGPNTQSNVMRRLSWDKPSITLSNFRKSNILHPESNRILTVSEAAAIMGLNKDFRFISDSLSAMQQMVSNGVTQAIGKIVKNAVAKQLDACEVVPMMI